MWCKVKGETFDNGIKFFHLRFSFLVGDRQRPSSNHDQGEVDLSARKARPHLTVIGGSPPFYPDWRKTVLPHQNWNSVFSSQERSPIMDQKLYIN